MEPGKLVDRSEMDRRWKVSTVVSVICGRLGGDTHANRHSSGSESWTCHRVADADGEREKDSERLLSKERKP